MLDEIVKDGEEGEKCSYICFFCWIVRFHLIQTLSPNSLTGELPTPGRAGRRAEGSRMQVKPFTKRSGLQRRVET